MKSFLKSLALGVALVGFAAGANAQHSTAIYNGKVENASVAAVKFSTPNTIAYQGQLAGSEGQVVNGEYEITVRIYSDNNGSNLVWEGTEKTRVQNGLFSLVLGSGENPLPSASAMNSALFVGVSVNGGTELRPLSQLHASPFAINVSDNSVSASKIQNGAVKKEKMGTDYVGSISLNGKKVTGKGTDLNFVAGDGLALQYDPVSNAIVLNNATAGAGKGAEIQANSTVTGNLFVVGQSPAVDVYNETGSAGVRTGHLRLYNSGNSFRTQIDAAAQTANRTVTIPAVSTDASFIVSTGDQAISGNLEVSYPVDANDAATKQYVDDQVSSITVQFAPGVEQHTNSTNPVLWIQKDNPTGNFFQFQDENGDVVASLDGDGNLTATSFTGSFSGDAAGFTGSLSGDVSGGQTTTQVDWVGGASASDVAYAAGAIAGIESDISDLQAADVTLQDNIDAEAAARAAADMTLQDNIDAEAAARAAADVTLQDNIDAEAAARAAADVTLQDNIDAEAAARAAADVTLQDNIDAEAAARAAADVTLQDNIDAEAAARAAADVTLQDNIDAEAAARAAADVTLQDNIDAEAAARAAADVTLQDNIDAEAAARAAADVTLQDNIDAEAAARAAADVTLQDNIDAETAARIAADQALYDQLHAEDFIPSTDNVYDLGSASFRWADGFFGGDVNADGSVNAGGDVNGFNFNASGNVNAEGNVVADGNVDATNVNATANVLAGANLSVGGNAAVTGNTMLSGDLSVSGDADFNGAFTMAGDAGSEGYVLVSEGLGNTPSWRQANVGMSMIWDGNSDNIAYIDIFAIQAVQEGSFEGNLTSTLPAGTEGLTITVVNDREHISDRITVSNTWPNSTSVEAGTATTFVYVNGHWRAVR